MDGRHKGGSLNGYGVYGMDVCGHEDDGFCCDVDGTLYAEE